MRLPPSLREAIDPELEGVSLRDLARAADTLSRRYRAEVRDHRFHVDDELAARAYLATRLPATYAAVVRSLQATTDARPDLAPRSLLDVGAGPGTATWAAAAQWPDLEEARLIEHSPAMYAIGTRLGAELPVRAEWTQAGIDAALPGLARHDLVLLAYVLDELAPAQRDQLIPRLWQLTADTLLIVEPGTSAGWQRILRARAKLMAAGAHILAPCPHAKACPLAPPDWCHFSARVPRSRRHREAKGGTVPWEDEKFIYLAVSRQPPAQKLPRVLAPPRLSKVEITLKLCQPSGVVAESTCLKRDRQAFRLARKVDWGDSYPTTDQPSPGTGSGN
jgi:ribosomal protein RSM22 (predicted rRNA methylase)